MYIAASWNRIVFFPQTRRASPLYTNSRPYWTHHTHTLSVPAAKTHCKFPFFFYLFIPTSFPFFFFKYPVLLDVSRRLVYWTSDIFFPLLKPMSGRYNFSTEKNRQAIYSVLTMCSISPWLSRWIYCGPYDVYVSGNVYNVSILYNTLELYTNPGFFEEVQNLREYYYLIK